jgi:hypothetical protein
MMARNINVPFKGRIQKRKTHHLQIITFGLQRAAGPYRWATFGLMHRIERLRSIVSEPARAISASRRKTALQPLNQPRIDQKPVESPRFSPALTSIENSMTAQHDRLLLSK